MIETEGRELTASGERWLLSAASAIGTAHLLAPEIPQVVPLVENQLTNSFGGNHSQLTANLAVFALSLGAVTASALFSYYYPEIERRQLDDSFILGRLGYGFLTGLTLLATLQELGFSPTTNINYFLLGAATIFWSLHLPR